MLTLDLTPPDAALPAAAGYLVRLGRYATAAEAEPVRAALVAAGYAGVRVRRRRARGSAGRHQRRLLRDRRGGREPGRPRGALRAAPPPRLRGGQRPDRPDLPTELPRHDFTCTDPSELVQYTPDFGTATDGSAEVEVVLDRRGRVSGARTPGGTIPPDGSVLGGTGDGATWLRAHALPRARVRVDVRVQGARRALGSPRLGAVNGGPRLLEAGEIAIAAAAEGFVRPDDPEFFYRFGIRRNPRTLAGVTPDGRLLLVAADGRAPGYANGLSFGEEAAVMRALGASDAVNLDGGGSTALAVADRLVTRPSDPTGERPVGDAIAVLP